MKPPSLLTNVRRPTWMLMVMALPLGVLVNSSTGGWDNLPGSLILLMGWEHEPTLLQRWIVKTISHLVIPGAIAFVVLRITRLGDWLAPNRLAMVALIAADVLLCGHGVWALYRAGTGGQPFVTGVASSIMGGALMSCFVVGLGSLLASTLWHRLVRNKELTKAKVRGLLREL